MDVVVQSECLLCNQDYCYSEMVIVRDALVKESECNGKHS